MARIQSAVGTSLRYILETVYGVTPAAPASVQEWERSGGSLSLQKETYTTSNIRADRQTAYMRHGQRSAGGQLAADLAIGAHTDFLKLTLANDWAAGATASGSFIVVDGEVTSATASFVGFDVGDVVEYTAGAETVRARISNKGLDNKSVLLIPLSDTDTITDVSSGTVSVEVLGDTIKNGKIQKSATFETAYPELESGNKYKRATGCMVGSAEIALPPTGLATISYTIDGKDSKPFADPIAATVTPPVLGSLLASVNGGALVNGLPMALITDFSISIDNALSGRPVVGSNFRPQIFMGKLGITGNATVYLEDLAFEGYFDEEEEISIISYMDGGDGSFLQITLPRVKLSSSEVTADGEDGATIQCAYTALLDAASNCMIKIQQFTAA